MTTILKGYRSIIIIAIVFILGILAATATINFMHVHQQSEQPNVRPVVGNTPTPVPQYVMCNDYDRITDKYKTPNGYYIIVNINTSYITNVLEKSQYEKTKIGEFVKFTLRDDYPGYGGLVERTYSTYGIYGNQSYALKPVTEKESGYRDACEVIS